MSYNYHTSSDSDRKFTAEARRLSYLDEENHCPFDDNIGLTHEDVDDIESDWERRMSFLDWMFFERYEDFFDDYLPAHSGSSAMCESSGWAMSKPEGWWIDRHEARMQKKIKVKEVRGEKGEKHDKLHITSDSHGVHGRKRSMRSPVIAAGRSARHIGERRISARKKRDTRFDRVEEFAINHADFMQADHSYDPFEDFYPANLEGGEVDVLTSHHYYWRLLAADGVDKDFVDAYMSENDWMPIRQFDPFEYDDGPVDQHSHTGCCYAYTRGEYLRTERDEYDHFWGVSCPDPDWIEELEAEAMRAANRADEAREAAIFDASWDAWEANATY